MKIFDIIKFCFKNLSRRKLRTFLTCAGIFLGTCSIVLTFAFSYTITKNIEEKMKKGGNINKIAILRKKYNPNRGIDKKKGKKMYDDDNLNDSTLKFDDKLVNKLSKIKGVDFVFTKCYGYDLFQCYYGKDYIVPGFNVIALDFSKPEALRKMGYNIAPGSKFVANIPNSKKKNVIAGSLFPFNFYYLKGKDHDEMMQSYYDVIYDSKKDVKPFFDVSKANLTGIILSKEGENQFTKICRNFWMQKPSFDDDDEDEKADKSKLTPDNLSGNKFELNITGFITEGNFDAYQNRDWEIIKKLKDDHDKEVGLYDLSNVYIDINTFKELSSLKKKINHDENSKDDKFAYDEIIVMAKDWDNVESIVNFVQDDLNYKTENLLSEIKEKQKQSAGIRAMLLALGIITVAVSALGIANMMFMAISERTREIGVMKVLGCSLGNIRAIFLTEAGIVGFIGGLIGVGGSYGIARSLSALVKKVGTEEFLKKAANSKFLSRVVEIINNFSEMFNIAKDQNIIIIPVYLLIAGVIFGTLVGIISGIAPANRAVRISACSAIRAEQ